MRAIFAATALVALAGCGSSSSTQDSAAAAATEITAPAEDTKIIAVTSHANWCGSCKALAPKVEVVRASNTFDGVEFFVIDYTDKDVEAFFADADTLGIGEAFRTEFSEGVKTGKLYLVDTSSGAIVSRVDKTMDEDAIKTAIEAMSV